MNNELTNLFGNDTTKSDIDKSGKISLLAELEAVLSASTPNGAIEEHANKSVEEHDNKSAEGYNEFKLTNLRINPSPSAIIEILDTIKNGNDYYDLSYFVSNDITAADFREHPSGIDYLGHYKWERSKDASEILLDKVILYEDFAELADLISGSFTFVKYLESISSNPVMRGSYVLPKDSESGKLVIYSRASLNAYCRDMGIDISEFNEPVEIPDEVRHCENMFMNCKSFNQSVKIPKNAVNCQDMFYGCYVFNQPIDIPKSVLSCCGMFAYCESFNQLVVIPEGVINCNGMFESCKSLNNTVVIPVSVDDNFKHMFVFCSNMDLNLVIAPIDDVDFSYINEGYEYLNIPKAPEPSVLFKYFPDGYRHKVLKYKKPNSDNIEEHDWCTYYKDCE